MAYSLTVDRETLNKLIQNVPSTGQVCTMLSIHKDVPPPLDPKQYPQVQFWMAKSFEMHYNNLTGETDALATQQRRPGQHQKSESNKDQHLYLENTDGSAIPWDILVKVGQRAQRLWQALNSASLVLSSWGKASKNAYMYFNSEMLNEPDFEFFRYCDSNWKITWWATKACASWVHNHFRPSDGGNNKPPCATKWKCNDLDDPLLLQIDNDMNKDTFLSNSNPVENNPTTLASTAPSGSALVPNQVCSHY